MPEIMKLENMDSDYSLSLNCQTGELENGEDKNISIFNHHMNGLQKHGVNESDSNSSSSYVVDMERFSHHIQKDINANSKLTLQRNFSRKGFVRSGGDNKKINPTISSNLNERLDATMRTTSPRATFHGGSSMPEKPIGLTLGATDHQPINPQVHHQITITNGNLGNNMTSESKISGKRFSSRRSPHSSWAIAPSRILLFFATVSSMGTILLIYFTLSMTKLNRDGTFPDSQ